MGFLTSKNNCENCFSAPDTVADLGLEETEEWRPWTLDGKDYLGGYGTRYKK
jgi:hypothetical protein